MKGPTERKHFMILLSYFELLKVKIPNSQTFWRESIE